jgi:hypothetical protein
MKHCRVGSFFTRASIDDPRSFQNQLFEGRPACELWSSKKKQLRASAMDEFLGKFRTQRGFWVRQSVW